MKQTKDMSKDQRRAKLLEYLKQHKTASRRELTEIFHISPNTLCVDLQSLQKEGISLEMPGRSGIVRLLTHTDACSHSQTLIEPITQAAIRRWTVLELLHCSSIPMSFEELCSAYSDRTFGDYSSDTLRKDIRHLKDNGYLRMLRTKPDGARTYCYELTALAPALLEKRKITLERFCDFYTHSGSSNPLSETLKNIYYKACLLTNYDAQQKFPAKCHLTHGKLNLISAEIENKLNEFQKFDYKNKVLEIPYHANNGQENIFTFATGLLVYSQEKNQFYLLGETNGIKTILRLSNIADTHNIRETTISNYIYANSEYTHIFHEMFSISLEEPMRVAVRFQKFGNIERKVRTLMSFRKHTKPTVDFEFSPEEIFYADTIRGLEDFARYLRSFGRAALVIEPPKLVERMKNTPLRVMEAYERIGIINESAQRL